jgi:cytochrome c5
MLGVGWLAVAAAGQPAFPEPSDPRLARGRAVWVENCMGCHGDGTAGAPVATDVEAWAPRIAQGKAVLYEHALNGFFGPDDTMMPARGGNDALTDDDVRAAVDYMVAVAGAGKPGN